MVVVYYGTTKSTLLQYWPKLSRHAGGDDKLIIWFAWPNEF